MCVSLRFLSKWFTVYIQLVKHIPWGSISLATTGVVKRLVCSHMLATITIEVSNLIFSWHVPVGSSIFLLLIAGVCFSGSTSLMISRSLKILVFFKKIKLRKDKKHEMVHKARLV